MSKKLDEVDLHMIAHAATVAGIALPAIGASLSGKLRKPKKLKLSMKKEDRSPILTRAEELVEKSINLSKLSAGRRAEVVGGKKAKAAVVGAKKLVHNIGKVAKTARQQSLAKKMATHGATYHAAKKTGNMVGAAKASVGYHKALAAHKAVSSVKGVAGSVSAAHKKAIGHYGGKAALAAGAAVAAGAYVHHQAKKKSRQYGESVVPNDKKKPMTPLQQELHMFHRQAGLPPPGPKVVTPNPKEESNLMHGMNAMRKEALLHGKVLSPHSVLHNGRIHYFHPSAIKHIATAVGAAAKKS